MFIVSLLYCVSLALMSCEGLIDCFSMFLTFSSEQGMVDEAQKALEEAEALRKVFLFNLKNLS